MTCFHVTFGESLHASVHLHCSVFSTAVCWVLLLQEVHQNQGRLFFIQDLLPKRPSASLSRAPAPCWLLHPNADLTPSPHLTQSADQAYPRWRSRVTHARQGVLIEQAHSCQLSTRWRSRVLKTCSCKLDWCFCTSVYSLGEHTSFWGEETFTQEIKCHCGTHFSVTVEQQ